MRKHLKLWTGFVAILLAGAPSAAEQSGSAGAQGDTQVVETSPYRLAADAPSYATATAHDPHYDDAALWPAEDVKTAAYSKQVWPKGRLMVWAKPGASSRGEDGADPKYWLEDGKPATKTFDENTDLCLPASEKVYWVTIKGKKYSPAPCRHVTIDNNARLIWQHSSRGNTWIKKGGSVLYFDSFIDKTDTFCRNDNEKAEALVDHLFIRKTGGASVEFLGRFTSDDELAVQSGGMIIGPGCDFGAGDRTTVTVLADSRLVVLSGSHFHRRNTCDWGHDIMVSGSLLAGTPQRPLVKDCRISLSYKSKGVFLGEKRDERMSCRDDVGLWIASSGELKVESADPKKARLVINCSNLDHDAQQVRILGDKVGRGATLLTDIRSLPHKVDMAFLGKVELDGVLFDDVLKGGILLVDPTARSQWKNISFGEGNQGKPEDLFRRYESKSEAR